MAKIVVLWILVVLLPAAILAQPASSDVERIVRVSENENLNRGEPASIQLISVSVGGKAIDLNRPFVAGDDWLEKFTVRVKNVGVKELSCVGISFGIVANIDTKLGPRQSWPWGLPLFRGKCAGKDAKSFSLKPGEEVDLKSIEAPNYDKILFDNGAKLRKAVLNGWAAVTYKGKSKDLIEVPILLPSNTFYPDDNPI